MNKNVNSLIFKSLIDKKYSLVFYALVILFERVAVLTVPLIIGNFINNLLSLTLFQFQTYLKKVILKIIIIFFIQMMAGYFKNKIFLKLSLDITNNLNISIIKKLEKATASDINLVNKNELPFKIIADTKEISEFYLQLISELVSFVFTLIFSVVVLFKYLPLFLLIALIATLFIFILYFNFRKRLVDYLTDYKNKTTKYNSSINDICINILPIKLKNAKEYYINNLRKKYKDLIISARKYIEYSNFLYFLDEFVMVVLQIFYIAIGGVMVLNKTINIGEFSILSSYYINLIDLIKILVSTKNKYSSVVSAKRRLEIIFSMKDELENDIVFNEQIKVITFKNITFGYTSKVIIQNFSETLETGKIYRINGSNGVGKTTLLYLLQGLYIERVKGEILINKYDIKKINIKKFRKDHICYLSQNNLIIDDGVGENIFLNNSTANKYITEYIKQCFDISELNRKQIKADTISGGEAKKINILRELINLKDICIFDEPENDLDEQSKRKLISMLGKIRKNRIVILVTHSDIFASIVDKNIYLDRRDKGI